MATIQFKRGTAARWAELNLVLEAGQPGFVTDENRLKIGDGTTAWNDLPYIGEASVVNAQTCSDFPSIGRENVIYKAEAEQCIYQWNVTNSAYELLGSTDIESLQTRISYIEADYLKSADKTTLETKIATDIAAAKTETIETILGETVPADFDTLKEIADWIQSDTTASTELVTRVSNIEKDYLNGTDKTELQGKIEALGTLVGVLPEDVASTTVVAYIQEIVDALKIDDYAKLTELNALSNCVQALEDVGAEKNVIATVDNAQFAVDDARNLTLLDIAIGKVTGLSDALSGKVSIEDGKRLMTEAEGTKLYGIAEGAQVNVIDSVDTAQFKIDETKSLTLLDIAMGKVSGLTDALSSKVDKVDGARLLTADEAAKLEKLVLSDSGTVEISGEVNAANVRELDSWITTNRDSVSGLLSAANETKLDGIEEGAQANLIDSVKVGDIVLEIVNKTATIPIGAGLKASDEVTITEGGTLGVGEVNVNKLVQTDDDILILNGGAAI